jgi:hypothetical protein
MDAQPLILLDTKMKTILAMLLFTSSLVAQPPAPPTPEDYTQPIASAAWQQSVGCLVRTGYAFETNRDCVWKVGIKQTAAIQTVIVNRELYTHWKQPPATNSFHNPLFASYPKSITMRTNSAK